MTKNQLNVLPEVFKRDSPKGAGRPKGKVKTSSVIDRNKQFREGIKNLMEVFPLGQSPKCIGPISLIHKKEF